jgi:hypothetical protein
MTCCISVSFLIMLCDERSIGTLFNINHAFVLFELNLNSINKNKIDDYQ